MSRLDTARRKVVRRTLLLGPSQHAVGGDIEASAGGSRVVALNEGSDADEPSVWLLDSRLQTRASFTGPCHPTSTTASLAGVTKGWLYVSGWGCEESSLWQIGP